MNASHLADRHHVPMFQNPVLNAPREHLTASEIVILRKLDRAGVALKVWADRRHWMIEGTRYADKALRRFVILGLALEGFEQGRITLRLNYTGRTVVELLRTRAVPGAVNTSDD